MKAVSLNDTLLNEPAATGKESLAAAADPASAVVQPAATNQSMVSAATAAQTTDFFFGPLNAQNKHKIVRRYVRNDFAPLVVAELSPTANPRPVYTCLIRSDTNPLAQRLFLLGANPKTARQLSDEVYEVNLVAGPSASQSPANLKKKVA